MAQKQCTFFYYKTYISAEKMGGCKRSVPLTLYCAVFQHTVLLNETSKDVYNIAKHILITSQLKHETVSCFRFM